MHSLHSLLIALGAAAPSALLLWLAAGVFTRSVDAAGVSRRGLRGMAASLGAMGVWWPLQLATAAADGGTGANPLWPFALLTLALGLPVLAAQAATSGEHWRSGRRAGLAAAALLTSTLAIAAAGRVRWLRLRRWYWRPFLCAKFRRRGPMPRCCPLWLWLCSAPACC